MSNGRAKNMLGVGGTRSHISRKAMHGENRRSPDALGRGPGPMAQKRELLRRLQQSRK